LSDEQAGLLVKSIFAYKAGMVLPELDPMTEMCFSFLKSTIDRDSERYDEICERRREFGQKGGQASASKRKQKEAKGSKSKHYDNEYDNDHDNDHDNDDDHDDDTSSSRARMREDEDFDDGVWNPDELVTTKDGTQIRLGDVHFGKTVKIGKVSKPSGTVSHPPLTEEEKERILNRLEEFKKRRAGG
jgi:hypothetical protein